MTELHYLRGRQTETIDSLPGGATVIYDWVVRLTANYQEWLNGQNNFVTIARVTYKIGYLCQLRIIDSRHL